MIKIGLFYEDMPNRNPSEKIFHELFSQIANTKTIEGNRLGSSKYLTSFIDNCDIVITHHYPYVIYDKTAPKKIDDRYFPPNYKEIIKHHLKIIKAIKDSQKPHIVLFTRSDWYSHSQAFWESIPSNAFIFGGFKKGTLNNSAKDEFIFEKFGRNIELGNNYFSDNQILPLRHILYDNELHFCNSFDNKIYDISILGVLYNRRKSLYNTLRHNKSIKLYNQALLLRLRKIFNRFDKRKYQFNHKILSYLFKRALCKSYISYTDGSELDMFVRKYLEIPSCKSLLYCDPFLDMENYGFIDGVNYIKRDPLHTQEQILSLLKDKAKLKEVSFNGFNLIKQNFTASSTKPILSSTLLSISNGSFTSLDWKEGKLLLEVNDV